MTVKRTVKEDVKIKLIGNYYKILGVQSDASPKAIHDATVQICESSRYWTDDEYAASIHRAYEVFLQCRDLYNKFLERFDNDLHKNRNFLENLTAIFTTAIFNCDSKYVGFLLEEVFWFDEDRSKYLVSLIDSLVKNLSIESLQWFKGVILSSDCRPFLRFHIIDLLHERCVNVGYNQADLNLLLRRGLWGVFFHWYCVSAVALCVQFSRTDVIAADGYFIDLPEGGDEAIFSGWLDMKTEANDVEKVFNFLISKGLKPSINVFSAAVKQVLTHGVCHFTILVNHHKTTPILLEYEKQNLLLLGLWTHEGRHRLMVDVFLMLFSINTVATLNTLDVALAYIDHNGKYFFETYRNLIINLPDDELRNLRTWIEVNKKGSEDASFLHFVSRVIREADKRKIVCVDESSTSKSSDGLQAGFWSPSKESAAIPRRRKRPSQASNSQAVSSLASANVQHPSSSKAAARATLPLGSEFFLSRGKVRRGQKHSACLPEIVLPASNAPVSEMNIKCLLN